MKCNQCEHKENGFLSEPDECSYFKEPYKWFLTVKSCKNKEGRPDWCPLECGIEGAKAIFAKLFPNMKRVGDITNEKRKKEDSNGKDSSLCEGD